MVWVWHIYHITANCGKRSGFCSYTETRKSIITPSQFESTIFSTRKASYEKLLEYMEYIYNYGDALFQFFSVKKWRQLKFRTYVKTQSAYTKAIKKWTNIPKNAYYGFGDANSWLLNKSPICSTPSCTKASIRLTQNSLKEWVVKICKKCKTMWNRDINASRNIRQVLIHLHKPTRDLSDSFQ